MEKSISLCASMKFCICELTRVLLCCLKLIIVWPGLKLIHGVRSRVGDPEYVSVQGPLQKPVSKH